MRRQCELLNVNRSSVYYECQTKEINDVDLLNEIRDIWSRYPFYCYRRITQELRSYGRIVNRKRIQRLMTEGGIKAIYPGPNTSRRNKQHAVYPYLLKDLTISRPNQAWQMDITYLRMEQGFMYLVALIDVYSRYVVSWSLSNTLETEFCNEALQLALKVGKPEIMNSDQGCQFTSAEWVNALQLAGISISMTGKGRCSDNIYIERFWRSFKQEEFYLNEYKTVGSLKKAISAYIEFYNHKRWHQSLDYKTPAEIYFGRSEQRQEPVDMWTSVRHEAAQRSCFHRQVENHLYY
ncbi:MAG TPA: IS3 family transposase [Gammaproteobacteria bacterium]|nr:IS3 family transposase [Gammaproteobacteria bacterium]